MGESFSFAKSAWELDPLIPAFALAHAERLGDIGHLDAYYDLMREYRRSWPDNFAFLSSPMLTSAVRGDWDQHAALEREVETFGLTVPPHVAQVVALVRAPPEAARQVILGQLDRQLETTRTIELGHFALAYSLGLRDEAFERLGRASFDHLFTQEGANPDSRFLAGTLFGCVNDGLRRDPRFAQLCVKLGLGDYWLSSGQWPDCVSETAPFYDLKASVTALPSPGRLASA